MTENRPHGEKPTWSPPPAKKRSAVYIVQIEGIIWDVLDSYEKANRSLTSRGFVSEYNRYEQDVVFIKHMDSRNNIEAFVREKEIN